MLATPPVAPETTPEEDVGAEASAANEAPSNERGFYMLAAVLGSLHFHASQYYFNGQGEVAMASAGGAYELLLMLGSHKKNFAFGGAASFVHAPRAELRFEDSNGAEYESDARPGTFALTVGPAVDYRPGKAFHLGGLIGLAVESVPKFEPEPSENDTVAGFGMGLWLGFDWKASEHLRPGILLTGHVRQELKRDIEQADDDDEDIEVSASLGLGFSLAYR